MSSTILPPSSPPLPFVVALRAVAALIIVWHHFALYPPLRDWAAPLVGELLGWFEHHARTTQVFFVVGGYVMARGMDARRWDGEQVRRFVLQRYLRLGLPYLGAIAVVLPAYLFARGWIPEAVLGSPVTWPQLLAHLFFLQDILGYESLSAGLWFVCINLQLSLIYITCLWLRDGTLARRIDFVGIAGWTLAALSLFHINLNPEWDRWSLYFFPYFFMGVVVHRALRTGGQSREFWLYQLMLVAAMGYEWRWRLLIAVLVGLLLYGAERTGLGARWPRNRVVAWLGGISYSLFLIHFPALVLVGSLWAHLEWTTPEAAVAGLVTAFFLSLAAGDLFHRWIEQPAARLARRHTLLPPRSGKLQPAR
ncbi:acyltransferase [Zoogloea sp.]|uniref:acyltransferase family protein n=1 Tax=Zoogloea sp. TaxID=49181 RepID=UPI00261B6F48|nr:acyltransferase [Zoogloea sp.]MDD3354344.1 acyltransferase [Zoogloea sp.]